MLGWRRTTPARRALRERRERSAPRRLQALHLLLQAPRELRHREAALRVRLVLLRQLVVLDLDIELLLRLKEHLYSLLEIQVLVLIPTIVVCQVELYPAVTFFLVTEMIYTFLDFQKTDM